jgi:hypothetical protein
MAVLVAALASSGCTSAISTAYLRDTFWDLAEHASEEEPESESPDGDAAEPVSEAEAADTAAADEQRRKAAIDEAVARLSKIGALDPAARDTLMETLQRTQQEDWPVVVEAFAASLAASEPVVGADDESTADVVPVIAASHMVAKADLDDAVVSPTPEQRPLSLPAEPPLATSPPVAPDPAPVSAPPALPPAPAPPEAAATFAVRNACFATRVQAWGVLDRFPAARFRTGQEVIVYFELDQLSSGQSAAGHTTCIDASLSLRAADGRVLRDWSFEPIAETCASKRHDYFARYVVRIPDDAPAGECRLELTVVDTLAGATARESLPLEIAAEPR